MPITALSATNVCLEWITTAVYWLITVAWVLGCVGYLNYRFFLLFTFWGGLWSTYIAVFTYCYMHIFNMAYYDYMFFVALNMMSLFSWVVFFFYGYLALKGLTIIEAGERFQNRSNSVKLSQSAKL